MDMGSRRTKLQKWYDYWVSRDTGNQTPEEAEAELLALIIEGRRIMLGMELDDPRLVGMEQETLRLLSQPDFLQPDESHLEVVLRRLTNGSGTGWAYLTKFIENRTSKFSELARKERTKDIFSRVIDQIVAEDPTVSAKAVIRKLKDRSDFDLVGDEIRYIGDDEASDAESLPVHRLSDRVSAAKARFRNKDSA